MKSNLRTLFTAIGLMFLSLTIGILGFTIIEDFDLLNAFYMTVITISTVGFSEVHEFSSEGRLFTAIYIIFNLGIFAYVLSTLTSYFFEGKLKLVFSNIMIDREISKFKDHIIVCGYGRNGSQACQELIKEGLDFVVIDKNPELKQKLPASITSRLIIGDATIDNNLREAGIERAKEIIITTPSDANNVFITLTARELQPDITIISRASQIETEHKLYRAGADEVIMPDYMGGMFMAQMVTKPEVIELLDLLTGRGREKEKYRLESIKYENLKPKYRNKTLRELDINLLTGASVIAVKDNIKGLIPSPPLDTLIGEDDTLIILCSEGNTHNVFEILSGK